MLDQNSLSQAKDFAEDWYLTLRGKQRAGELHNEKSFAEAAEKFMHEYEVLTEGERNERWVKDHYRRIRMHLNPFFGEMGLSTINAGVVQDYRISRLKPGDEKKKIPSRSTLHHETVTLRMVLKTAVRYGWITHVRTSPLHIKGQPRSCTEHNFHRTNTKKRYMRQCEQTSNQSETAYIENSLNSVT